MQKLFIKKWKSKNSTKHLILILLIKLDKHLILNCKRRKENGSNRKKRKEEKKKNEIEKKNQENEIETIIKKKQMFQN